LGAKSFEFLSESKCSSYWYSNKFDVITWLILLIYLHKNKFPKNFCNIFFYCKTIPFSNSVLLNEWDVLYTSRSAKNHLSAKNKKNAKYEFSMLLFPTVCGNFFVLVQQSYFCCTCAKNFDAFFQILWKLFFCYWGKMMQNRRWCHLWTVPINGLMNSQTSTFSSMKILFGFEILNWKFLSEEFHEVITLSKITCQEIFVTKIFTKFGKVLYVQ
jgi:hypothetical protein